MKLSHIASHEFLTHHGITTSKVRFYRRYFLICRHCASVVSMSSLISTGWVLILTWADGMQPLKMFILAFRLVDKWQLGELGESKLC